MLLIITALAPLNLSAGNTRGWIPLPDPLPVDMLLEESVSRRMSFRAYTTTSVTDEELSTVLWAAYGVTTSGGRTVYSPNGTYSTTMYVIRSDATYIYVPGNHSLFLWKTGNYLGLGQNTGAPIKFGLVWNKSIAPDEKAGMAEIGMIAQGVYYEANALGLAAITTGMNADDLYELGLPSNEKAEIIMHLGHPTTPYNFNYNPLPPSNLPAVVNSTMTLADAVNARHIVNAWNNTELTLLEASQVLWCSYGTSYLYDNINHKRHRTPPSAIGIYPFKIYAANQSGVYQYSPSTHSVSLVVSGDKRELIQDAVDHGNISVTSAPLIIIPFWDKSMGGQNPLTWWQYESGAIINNVLLEAAALNLSSNVLSVITDQNALRSALGLSGQTNLIAMHVAMIGHVNQSSQNDPPLAPDLSGPTQGTNGVSYNYTVSAIDNDGDDVFYYVDWGDQTSSGWIGPFASGTPVTFNHSWAFMGTYTIKARAQDSHGLEGIWSLPLQMTISGPGLEIAIKGGLGVTVTVTNNASIPVTNVKWEIAFSGGFAFPDQKTGSITTIPVDGQETFRMMALGLGRRTVTVSLQADDGISMEKPADCFLFVFFVFGVT